MFGRSKVQELTKKPSSITVGKPALAKKATDGPRKPVHALGVDAMHLQPGARVWVPDSKELWRVGEIETLLPDGSANVFVPDSPDDKHQVVATAAMLAFDPSHLVDHTDIAQMNNMHEAPLLSVLHRRYLADAIYTFTTDILISVNPYKSIPLLYDVMGFMEATKSQADCEIKKPHLFTIAEKAYRDMRNARCGETNPQSIVVSGESGAGKTEASKHIMKYLAVASKLAEGGKTSKADASLHEKIEECVLLSNHVLESFGNAKTSRNDNSSRFGKYIQILYNGDGRMNGVAIKHFLLEKTRIVAPETNERNYHVFYQMLAGLDANERAALELQDAAHYNFLTYGNCLEIDGVDDASDFRVLRASMTQLGFAPSTQQEIFQVLAGVLKLGNARFSLRADDREACQFATNVPVAKIAGLFRVAADELEDKMTTQTTVTGRGSILRIKLSCDQAEVAKQALCKYLYGEIFNYIISRLNAMCGEHTKPGKHPFIGILDIFGFEIMPTNSFEQLCINFANEMLQQQFNRHVFVLEQERYASEGISVSVIEFQDNQECLDLIQKSPAGIFPLLDEQIMLKRKTTDRQLLNIYHQTHLDKHPHYAKPRFESDDFVIKHYAGDVTYSVHGFVSKNTDNLHEDLVELLRTSQLPVLSAIFAPAPQPISLRHCESSGTPTHRRQVSVALVGSNTVASKFRTQLTGLMEMLGSTTPHYIKCIKPNNIKFAGGFSSQLVRDQLVYGGILEVIKIRQQGYPIRRPFNDFYQTFAMLLRGRRRAEGPATDTIELVRSICESSLLPNAFQIGKREVYLRYGQLELLQSVLTGIKGEIATVLQSKFWRCHSLRRRYQQLRTRVITLQAKWRQRAATKSYAALQHYTRKLQANRRCKTLLRLYARKQAAAIRLHAIARGFATRQRLVRQAKMQTAAIAIQRIARGFLQRTKAERALRCRINSAVTLQARFRGYLQLRRFHRMYESAVTIQALFRAHRNRQQYLRGKAAMVASQALIRKILQRKRFMHQRRMVIRLQAFARMVPPRGRYSRLRTATVLVQSLRRGYTQRRRYLAQQHARATLRSHLVMYVHKRRFRVLRCSTIRIQRALRVYLSRRAYIHAQRSVRKLQRTVRAYLRRRRLAIMLQHLRDACVRRDADAVILALRLSPEYIYIRHKAAEMRSLLHVAACAGDLNVVKYICLHALETLHARNAAGHMPLHDACLASRLDVVKFLVAFAAEKAPMDPAFDDGDERGMTDSRRLREASKSYITSAVDANGVTVHTGFLKKRREASRWSKRFVALRNTHNVPELHYFKSKSQTKSDKVLDMRKALFKKCADIPFAFEVHSPELLEGRNREGRLYFQAESELELQMWLACLRDTVPTSLEHRLFAMQRSSASMHFVSRSQQQAWCNVPTRDGESPLHLAVLGKTTADPRDAVKAALWFLENTASVDKLPSSRKKSLKQVIQETNQVLSPLLSPTTKLDSAEIDAIKLVLWLVEHGADMNRISSLAKKTPLKLAIERNYHTLAKFLLDRGATTAELSPFELTVVQSLKAELAKIVVTSVQSSASKKGETPMVFLMKQPGLVRHSSYLSVYVEQIGLPNAQHLSRPRVIVSVYDVSKNLIEKKQLVTCLPLAQTSLLYYGFTWFMQTPFENLPSGAFIVFEVQAASKLADDMPSSPKFNETQDICWTFIHIDQRSTTTCALNAEMYAHPVDLKFKKLQRFDAFISGDISVLHG
ncbi:hypothetical protein SDRG_12432 [Saprolegnia diclina VS20]|uniref:Myosin-like protein n=1 Tax=Saprolegnia diclina (strain VS20) TaxID=1156394 RepID=T0RCD9_SAPDV|nr:hypothetical protein SDRG_12432 [Saprolegnia diclina VS20]EQC29888.1 hypothetical protein SDRG_12432 [Saprolegnia diclina VS20]|eukprot:XP_008616727.1 hypothetical protein SDRG_12432 [Saprolegnia diclina VS20]